MKEQVDISSDIKQRLVAYCSESNCSFDSVLHEAICCGKKCLAKVGGERLHISERNMCFSCLEVDK